MNKKNNYYYFHVKKMRVVTEMGYVKTDDMVIVQQSYSPESGTSPKPKSNAI